MNLVPYQEFGAALVDEAVTPARIETAVAEVAGERVEVGPLLVGPGDAASVMATGVLGAPRARLTDPDTDGTRRFVVAIPVDLRLSVKVAGTLHRFEATVLAHLRLAVRTATDPLSLVIDIQPPAPFDLEVDVRASGLTARVLGRLGNIDGKIRKEVVEFIRRRLDAPDARAATVIDISQIVDTVWET